MTNQSNDTELTQEEMAQMLLTTYDVQDTRSPLRKFGGRVQDTKVVNRTYRGRNPGEEARVGKVIIYTFSELRVDYAANPYPYQTGTLEFSHSTGTRSAWAHWAVGIKDIVGPVGVFDLTGKWLEVDYTAGHMFSRRDPVTAQWSDVEGSAYVVISIDGKSAGAVAVPVVAPTPSGVAGGAPTAMPTMLDDAAMRVHLAELADGKTINEFSQVALQDARVNAAAPWFNSLLGSSEGVIQDLEQHNLIVKQADGTLIKRA